jgi:hypothetical protein
MKKFTISENKEIDFKIEMTPEEKEKSLNAKKIVEKFKNDAIEKLLLNGEVFLLDGEIVRLPEEQRKLLIKAQENAKEQFKDYKRVYINKE